LRRRRHVPDPSLRDDRLDPPLQQLGHPENGADPAEPDRLHDRGRGLLLEPAGALLATQAFSLAAKNTLVVGTVTIAGLSGQSGAITIAHDGRYGDLTGKAVALEPATGYSFDSPMLWRSVR